MLSEIEYFDIKKRLETYDFLFKNYSNFARKILWILIILIFVTYFIWSELYFPSIRNTRIGSVYILVIGILGLLVVLYYLNILTTAILKFLLSKKVNLPNEEELKFYKNYAEKMNSTKSMDIL